MSSTIRVGQIVGAFGIKGQLKALALTDFIERFEPGRRLRMNDQWVTVEDSSIHKGHLVLSLSGVKDRTQAEKLQWVYLEALADERPDLDDDEYLTAELVGLSAIDESGNALGTVTAVQRYPAHDILVVDGEMIPAVAEFVREVDLKAKTITIRPIPGMFATEEEDVSG